MGEFKKKNVLERMLTEQKELEQYYRDLRKYEYENNVPLNDKEYYEKRYRIIKKILTLELALYGHDVKIYKDLRNKQSSASKIYSMTHIGRFDIESSVITRGEHACFLWGDPGTLYKSPEKLLMNYLDPIYVDLAQEFREDCHIGQKNMVRHAISGINTQIYPEGAYNIFMNKVVMPLFDGAVKTAIEANKERETEIIPCAVIQDGRTFYVYYGENIKAEYLEEMPIKEATKYLRDAMATLKWELVREHSGSKVYVGDSQDDVFYTKRRADVQYSDYQEFIKEVMSGNVDEYGVDEIEKTRYKDKHECILEEVDEYIEECKKENPLLFLSTTERFLNYCEVKKQLDEIEKELKDFQENAKNDEEEPLYKRLINYKKSKQCK